MTENEKDYIFFKGYDMDADLLIEKFGGFAFEKQLFFAELVGKMDWEVDIKKGEISFGDSLTFPIQILGTFSHSSETWLWAWANEQSGLPEKLITQAEELRKYGTEHNIDLLTEGEFEIERDDMHYIGLIALGLSEANGYYLGNYGAGTMCLTIKSKKIEKEFPNDHISIFTTFPQLISQFEINHKEAFEHYLTQKKYKLEKNGNEIIGAFGPHKVKASFDNLGRLISLKDGDK